jgi:hypothetical protein
MNSSFRSGSTFLSDILNHYPGTFYTFEPFYYHGQHSQTIRRETDFLSKVGYQGILLFTSLENFLKQFKISHLENNVRSYERIVYTL